MTKKRDREPDSDNCQALFLHFLVFSLLPSPWVLEIVAIWCFSSFLTVESASKTDHNKILNRQNIKTERFSWRHTKNRCSWHSLGLYMLCYTFSVSLFRKNSRSSWQLSATLISSAEPMRTPKTLKIAEIQARRIAVDWESLGYNITRCHTFNVTICYHYFRGHNESRADCLDMDPKAPQHVVNHLPPYTNVSLKMILTNPEGRKESEETIIQTDEDGMFMFVVFTRGAKNTVISLNLLYTVIPLNLPCSAQDWTQKSTKLSQPDLPITDLVFFIK